MLQISSACPRTRRQKKNQPIRPVLMMAVVHQAPFPQVVGSVLRRRIGIESAATRKLSGWGFGPPIARPVRV